MSNHFIKETAPKPPNYATRCSCCISGSTQCSSVHTHVSAVVSSHRPVADADNSSVENSDVPERIALMRQFMKRDQFSTERVMSDSRTRQLLFHQVDKTLFYRRQLDAKMREKQALLTPSTSTSNFSLPSNTASASPSLSSGGENEPRTLVFGPYYPEDDCCSNTLGVTKKPKQPRQPPQLQSPTALLRRKWRRQYQQCKQHTGLCWCLGW